jgi:DNA-binding ferritin-like protein
MKYSRKSTRSSVNKTGRSSVNKTRKNISSNSSKKQIVTQMLEMLITVKLYHWNTLSHSVHTATDELYGELNTLIDQFVEVLLGKQKNISERNKNEILSVKSLHMNNYKDNGMFKKEIETYKKYLIGLTKQLHQIEDSDLLNIRDEILATLNKISFLLTLK